MPLTHISSFGLGAPGSRLAGPRAFSSNWCCRRSYSAYVARRNRYAGLLDLEIRVALHTGRIEQSRQNRLPLVLNVTAGALRRRAQRTVTKMRRHTVAAQTGLVRHHREDRFPGHMTARTVVGEKPMLH